MFTILHGKTLQIIDSSFLNYEVLSCCLQPLLCCSIPDHDQCFPSLFLPSSIQPQFQWMRTFLICSIPLSNSTFSQKKEIEWISAGYPFRFGARVLRLDHNQKRHYNPSPFKLNRYSWIFDQVLNGKTINLTRPFLLFQLSLGSKI